MMMMIDDEWDLFLDSKEKNKKEQNSGSDKFKDMTRLDFRFDWSSWARQKHWSHSATMRVNCSMIGSLSSSSSSSSWTTSIPTRQTCPHLSGVLCACMHIVMYRAIEQHCSSRLLPQRKQNTWANIEVTSRHAEHAVVRLMIFEGWYALCISKWRRRVTWSLAGGHANSWGYLSEDSPSERFALAKSPLQPRAHFHQTPKNGNLIWSTTSLVMGWAGGCFSIFGINPQVPSTTGRWCRIWMSGKAEFHLTIQGGSGMPGGVGGVGRCRRYWEV